MSTPTLGGLRVNMAWR